MTRAGEIQRKWHVIDASDRVLGRVATEIAGLLMGKTKSSYSPFMDTGDFVVVINASKVKVTGKKLTDKIYHRHTGYPGGLRSTALGDMLDKHPTRVIELAVRGMLPHNRMGRAMFKKLKVYSGDTHPHEGQVGSASTNVALKEGSSDGK